MKTLKFIFVSLLFIQMFAVIWFAQPKQSATREISIQISGFRSTGDRFVFRDHNLQDHIFDSNQTKILGRFPVGSNYSLTQMNGPRECRMTNNQGIVPDRDVIISINCAAAPSQDAELSVQIQGFRSNSDSFTFKDQTSREHTFNSNGTRLLGRFSVGNTYSLMQISGPRQCRLTNSQGTISTTGAVISIDCTASQSAEREISIQITGFRSISDSFVFRDQSSREHTFSSNQTKILGRFPVGSAYSLTQTSGPRQCRMTNNQGTVPTTDLTIIADCTNSTPTPTPTPNLDINLPKIDLKLQLSGVETGETFNFKTQQITRGVEFIGSATVKLGSYAIGTNYSVLQNGGPRQCRMSNNQGNMQGLEVIVIADCSKSVAATAPIKFTISGVQAGESFTFKDIDNQQLTFTASLTRDFGSFAVGSNYNYAQTARPRQCQMTNNQGVLSNSALNVLADCAKTSVENPAPTGKFGDFDLISRSSDQKSFGTFYGSITPSIGGINETGVTEGQFVAYMTSWNLDPKHGGKARQIMWFNRGNGRAAVVSHTPDGIGGDKDSYNPSIDNKGYTVAFESLATNLVSGDANKVSDIFVWTLMDDTVRCVTCSGNYGSTDASLSGDGNYVAFTSYANNLAAGVEGNSTANVYLANLRTGDITLISKDQKTGKGLSGMHPSVSEDGSRVAFYSYSDKLVGDDNNKLWDIFVWTRGNPQLKRVSLTADGMERDQGSESMSRVVKPAISGNGKYVTFATTAKNMGGSPTGKAQNVYVVEVDTGRVIRASEGIENTAGNDDSPVEQGERISISYDGRWVAFTTKATNLGGKIILRNIETGETIPFVVNSSGGVGTPVLSRNGKCIVFPSNEKLDKRFDTSGIFTACR